jgi:hypothetical protein
MKFFDKIRKIKIVQKFSKMKNVIGYEGDFKDLNDIKSINIKQEAEEMKDVVGLKIK